MDQLINEEGYKAVFLGTGARFAPIYEIFRGKI
jgi:hypothetical protein